MAKVKSREKTVYFVLKLLKAVNTLNNNSVPENVTGLGKDQRFFDFFLKGNFLYLVPRRNSLAFSLERPFFFNFPEAIAPINLACFLLTTGIISPPHWYCL